MSRAAALLLSAAIGLAGCGPAVPPGAASAAPEAVPAGLCRVGADGGAPVVADRGIGGTGAPVRVADRGIGGTGAPAGRTGIVGVITGFASVCLAGQEVQYGPDLPVLVDGRAARPDSLRAGQVAVVVAEGAAPTAASLAIRHEVSGPVERVEGDLVRVAGQPVAPPPGPVPAVGRWVEVSGVRRADGVIAATRLDPRGAGEVLIRGIMEMRQGRWWIGLTEIRPGRWQERGVGIPVVAVGRLNGGVLEADTVEVDALLVDPGTFFGPAVQVLVLEGYAEGGVFRFGRGIQAGAPFGTGRALTRLERGPGGGFAPSAAPALVRPGPGGADAFGGAGRGGPGGPASRGGVFEAAPVPNRGMDRAGRAGGEPGPAGAGNRDRGARRGGERRGGENGPEPGGTGPGGGGFGGGGGFRGPGR